MGSGSEAGEGPLYLVSFTERDAPVATDLQQELTRIFRGRVRFAISKEIRFEQWRPWIRRTLEACRGVIALWSRYSIGSSWMHVEVGVGWYEDRSLFNIVLEADQLPRFAQLPFAEYQAHVLSPETLSDLVTKISEETGVAVDESSWDRAAVFRRLEALLAAREDTTARLEQELRRRYPRFYSSFPEGAIHPLYFGSQFFPGYKRGVAISYNRNDNSVHVQGTCTDDAPSFGSILDQPVKKGSRLCFTVDVGSLGPTTWSRAFFRLDCDDGAGNRQPLRAIEPPAAEDDWYVKIPERTGSVLYQFEIPESFTKLTRMQVVLAANARYDLRFHEFAVVDFE